jgi:hypothetical protein
MHNHELTKPEHMSEQDWLRHLQWVAEMGCQASEGYAQHLARLTPDADRSKDLLQAHYKALHAVADSRPGEDMPRKD